jgi:hypothetical protein
MVNLFFLSFFYYKSVTSTYVNYNGTYYTYVNIYDTICTYVTYKNVNIAYVNIEAGKGARVDFGGIPGILRLLIYWTGSSFMCSHLHGVVLLYDLKCF